MSNCKNNAGTEKDELVLLSPKDSIVYYDETPEFIKDSIYNVILQFNHPIAQMAKSDSIFWKEDSLFPYFQKSLFFAKPFSDDKKENKNVNTKLDSLVALHYWDSTHAVDDINNPGTKLWAPNLDQVNIIDWTNSCELRIPAGTFTDVNGNKNKAIHIVYKKKKGGV
jgi:hypothetical protein